jgi:hypothetical protein
VLDANLPRSDVESLPDRRGNHAGASSVRGDKCLGAC